MVDASGGSEWQCAFCHTPIVRTDKLVQVFDQTYCCPNCELAAQRGELARRAPRGGGYVLACLNCGTPIFFPEIMVVRGTYTYCCGNCAEVAQQRALSQPVAARPRPSTV